MNSLKSLKLWIVNIIAFFFFAILSITGLIKFLMPSNGHRGGSDILGRLSHIIREIHEIAALAFIVIIAIHVLLHWDYIKLNLKKYRTLR